jgi:hypothetical protein
VLEVAEAVGGANVVEGLEVPHATSSIDEATATDRSGLVAGAIFTKVPYVLAPPSFAEMQTSVSAALRSSCRPMAPTLMFPGSACSPEV